MNHQQLTAFLRGPSWLPAAAAVILFSGCANPGMRLLRMEVYQNERLMLRTMFDAPDREGPADFWRRAGAEPFASEDIGLRVKPDADDPLRANLTGSVQIKIVHVDKVMTSATLTNLVLQRTTPAGLQWYLPPEEVQRATQATGL